ncbi:TIGR00730 family Rossman fold protein [Phragmitibacter flavus]|uniref:Cytokinin riboside 5'-monophosphate phosphoribohydrolase n=2 Tax=Phragmitibacter flavus TaxID=2576071 RepID=A0A5R8KEA1_9BACT|nr:TIGR00730 family Rossman fold protein [Phragmitibacter flavus]
MFLRGPNWRTTDLRLLMGTIRDFLRAFRALHFVGPCITVFGSARTPESHPHYQLARKVGAEIAKLGFTVMTGGGPGIMEAANRGAKEVGGRSVGCNIELPMEQQPNPWLDRTVTLQHFFVRKTILMKYSYGFVVLPGGVGTMDETFEALTLIQTGKIRHFPIVLMGVDYWRPLMDFVERMPAAGMIATEDLALIHLTDSVEDAMAHLKDRAIRQFGLRRGQVPEKRLSWLFENRCGKLARQRKD